MIGETVELRLTIFRARTLQILTQIYYYLLADFSSARSRVGGLHTTPPSLVPGRGDEGSAATRQGRLASTRGWSRRQRGLPEMWLEAVHRDRRWGATDIHHEVLVAGDLDAVGTAIGRRQSRQQRGRPHIHERGGAQRLGWRHRWRRAASAVRHAGKRRLQLADERVWGRLGGSKKLARQGKRASIY
jgi:hypothetical protein